MLNSCKYQAVILASLFLILYITLFLIIYSTIYIVQVSCTAHGVQHRISTVIRNIITDPGWVSYLRADAFYTTFTRTAPGFLIFLQISGRLSSCPVSYWVSCVLDLLLIGCPMVYEV